MGDIEDFVEEHKMIIDALRNAAPDCLSIDDLMKYVKGDTDDEKRARVQKHIDMLDIEEFSIEIKDGIRCTETALKILP